MSDNIWIAASNGDLARVQHLIETQGVSPNAKDANTYTPLHAAASWGHADILRYLVSKSGDINVTDSDGETPLFVAETEELARVCIDLGADASHRNGEGKTAAAHHQEDAPSVSAYLASVTGETLAPLNPDGDDSDGDDDSADGGAMDTDLLESAQAVLAEADRTGADPDDALREIVTAAVSSQLAAGLASGGTATAAPEPKRVRREDVGR